MKSPPKAFWVHSILLFVLFFSPLAFGAVEPWSLTIMEAASFGALFLMLLFFRMNKAPLTDIPGIAPLLGLLGLMLFQITPLPSGIVKFFSPAAYDIYRRSVLVVMPEAWVSLSVNVKATAGEFLRFGSYAAVYALTVQLLSERRFFRRSLSSVAILSASIAFLSLLQRIFWNGKIYWVRPLTHYSIPFGPYVNRNHYAGLMVMMFPVVFSFFLMSLPKWEGRSWREKIVSTFDRGTNPLAIGLGIASALSAISIFFSLSRGGIVSLVFSMIIFYLLLVSGQKRRGPALIMTALALIVFFATVQFGLGRISDRFLGLAGTSGDNPVFRLHIWKEAAAIVKDFPLTGAGFGTFAHLDPSYRTEEVVGILSHVHNDYLEFLAGGGLIGAGLALLFLYLVLIGSYRAFEKRSSPVSLYFFAGALAGISAFLMHGLVDFNLQIGANGLFFFFVLGLSVSASRTKMKPASDEIEAMPAGRQPGALSVAAALIVGAASLIYGCGQVLGVYYFSEAKDIRPGHKAAGRAESAPVLRKAAIFDPLEGSYRSALSRISSEQAESFKHLTSALRLDPLYGDNLHYAAMLLSARQRDADAFLLFKAGTIVDRMNPIMYQRYASWLFGRGMRDEGILNVRQGLSVAPARTRDFITIMALYGLSDQEISSALPDLAVPHLAFAEFLDRTGNSPNAAKEYRKAFGLMTMEKGDNSAQYLSVFNYFSTQGRIKDAAAVITAAVGRFRSNASVRLTAARFYERNGDKQAARREYKAVYALDPRNDEARKKSAEPR